MRTTNNFPVSNTPHNTPSEPSKPSGLWAKINTVFDKHGVDAAVSFAKTVKSTGVLFLSMAKVLTGQSTESKSMLKPEPAPKSSTEKNPLENVLETTKKELRDLQALEKTRVAYIGELEKKFATALVTLTKREQMSNADLPEDLQEAKSANIALQDELAQKIDACINLEQELDAQTALFKENITLAKNKALEIRQEALHAKAEVDTLLTQVNELTSANKSLSNQVDKLKQTKDALQEELERAPEELADKNRATMASIKANIKELPMNPSPEDIQALVKTLSRLLDY